MKKYIFLLLIASACVPAKKYNALKSQMDGRDTELVEAKATITKLNKQLEDAQEEKKALTQDLRKLTSAKSSAKDKDEKIHTLEVKVKDLEAKIAYLEKNQNSSVKTNGKDKPKKPKNAY